MNRTVLLLGIVLADVLGLSAWALYHHGYVGLFEAAVASPAGIQVFFDLVIALSLFTIWMWRDARERGIAALPFVVLTATLGSIGALAYCCSATRRRRPEHGLRRRPLIRRPSRERHRPRNATPSERRAPPASHADGYQSLPVALIRRWDGPRGAGHGGN
jgi:hypothetical protein